MQDRFKYRVWNNKKRKYEDAENDTLDYFICCIPGVVYESHCCVFDDLTEAEEGHYSLEQCTGLKDKNGKLIYEGDILGYYDKDGKLYNVGSVKYGVFNCSCCEGVYGFTADDADIRQHGDYVILGNIHENIELLED